MKILTGSRIKDADRFTIENEPVGSLALMERAAESMAQWICNNTDPATPLVFLVGKGNNGGDGLAMARILYHAGFECAVYMTATEPELSTDCRCNLERLPAGILVHFAGNVAGSAAGIPSYSAGNVDVQVNPQAVIIDALLGSGVKGEVSGELKDIIDDVNSLHNKVISVDIPSGMPTENATGLETMIHAATTLTIQFPKLAMLSPESGEAAGEIVVVDIGLSKEFIDAAGSPYYYIDADLVISLLQPRRKFAHKGTYGHALLVCGSKGMTGAAVLATGAALRSGCGLVTVHVPGSEQGIIHTTNPSAIVSCDSGEVFSEQPVLDKYNVIGVGPGIGVAEPTKNALSNLLRAGKPIIIDADAINIIASDSEMLSQIPEGSVLTPHIGELRRLIGEWGSDDERNEKTMQLAMRLKVVILVKGAHTMVCIPDGRFFFNSTGNSGMAKGGSGDVLTGYLTGLMARGYRSAEAAVIAVYIHGAAGDKAAEYFGVEGMNSQDIIDFLGEAMAEISR